MLYFVVNTHGGSGRASKTWRIVERMLTEKQIAYGILRTEYPGHATKLVADLCATGESDIRIIIVGGDGTINEVLNGIPDFTKVKIGVIPTGSGNDFARGATIPRNTKKALERILKDEAQLIDIGMTCIDREGDTYRDSQAPRTSQEKRYFGISSGFGMDAIVCKRALTSRVKKVLNFFHLGGLTYIILTVQSLWGMTMEQVTVVFNKGLPDEQHIDFNNLIFLAGMNFAAEGGGVPMAPQARADDGELSVCCAYGIPKLLALVEFPLLILGKQSKLKGFYLTNCKTLDVQAVNPLVVHLDGEYGGDVRSIHMECLPKTLYLL